MSRKAEANQQPRHEETFEEFKASLGVHAAQFTEAQLVQLRIDLKAAARLLIDLYRLKKQATIKRRVFDSQTDET